jgi:hypothetical protein
MLVAELEFATTLAHDIRTSSFEGTMVWRRLHELRAEGIPTEEIFADPVTHLGEEARPLTSDWPATRPH